MRIRLSRHSAWCEDAYKLLRLIDSDQVASVVTDPPYGLNFMSKGWDHEVPGKLYWREVLRVAKPGAHLVAFGGTRKYHRLACAIEDAGWEIRDCLSWMYGQGFPKSLDVSKAVDGQVMLGSSNSRYLKKVNEQRPGDGRVRSTTVNNGKKAWVGGATGGEKITRDEPATEEGAAWRGWGTALKPAWEPIILARKPLVGTVAENVIAHGTGGLNVDGCRIGDFVNTTPSGVDRRNATLAELGYRPNAYKKGPKEPTGSPGRWPANVLLDEAAAALLDAQTGGGESRFFYVAKASRSERTHGGKVDNKHPTVKPVALMRWLVRLVTPVGGVVLDPFMGSGSTGVAAMLEGFDFVGIDKDRASVETARQRLAQTLEEVT